MFCRIRQKAIIRKLRPGPILLIYFKTEWITIGHAVSARCTGVLEYRDPGRQPLASIRHQTASLKGVTYLGSASVVEIKKKLPRPRTRKRNAALGSALVVPNIVHRDWRTSAGTRYGG